MKSRKRLTIFDADTFPTTSTTSRAQLESSSLRASRLAVSMTPRQVKMISCSLPQLSPLQNSRIQQSTQQQHFGSAVGNQNQTTPSEFFKICPLEERLLSVQEERVSINNNNSLFFVLMHEKTGKKEGNISQNYFSGKQQLEGLVTNLGSGPRANPVPSLKLQIEHGNIIDEVLNSQNCSPQAQKVDKKGRNGDSSNKLSEEPTGQSSTQPKFYSDIINIRGKRPLVVNYNESLKQLERENKELREKVVQQKLQDLRL